ncbi:hypothetical protein CPB85DRAFT_1431957 [Mucidula mucida]|nr:hypothetical protein CPB85DRAFT_1431957 [Mucidula mucida]
MNTFAAQIAACAAQRDGNLPPWSTDGHAESTTVNVPVEELNKAVSHIYVHAARSAMGQTSVAHFRLYLQLKGVL